MPELISRERARQRLQMLAKDAAKIETGRLPNQLSAFAVIVQADDVVLIEWVRNLLEELSRDTGEYHPERTRIVHEARTLVHDLLGRRV